MIAKRAITDIISKNVVNIFLVFSVVCFNTSITRIPEP